MAEAEKEYLDSIALYLLNKKKSKINIHQGVCEGQRVNYFRGKRAIAALTDPSFKASFPKSTLDNKNDAKKILTSLIQKGYLLPVEKVKPKVLHPVIAKEFNDEIFYVWVYEDPSNQRYTIIKGALLVAGVLLLVLFPIWPYELRVGAWYLSLVGLAFVGLLVAILIIRIPVFYISRLVNPPGIWVFPNINEDVSFLDSFKPVWDWDRPVQKTKKRKSREEAGSGSENKSGSPQEDGDDDGEAETEGRSSLESQGTGERASPSLSATSGEVRRRKLGSETRLDSENDGDTEEQGATTSDNDAEKADDKTKKA